MDHIIKEGSDLGTQIGRALANAFHGDTIVVPNDYAAALANVGKIQVALRDPHLEAVMESLIVVIAAPTEKPRP